MLLASGGILTACVLFWSRQGNQTGQVASYLLAYAAAFAAYLAALQAAAGISARGLRLALGAALLWRLLLVPAPPLLSDDVYRYVWEGRIQGHGGNPYRYADRPEAERWIPLRDAVWRAVNHKDYPAIYPPAWQLVARGVVAVHDSVATMKLTLVACELATLATLAALLRGRGLPPERVLVLAWSPLALVEVAGSGHNEPLGMLLLALALLALDRQRPLASAVLVALAAQAKLLPGLLAAPWLRRYRPLHLAMAAAVVALLVRPYASAGGDLLFSLSRYGQYWRFNETVFALLASAAGSHTGGVVVGLMLLGAVIATLATRRSEAAGASLAVVAAWLLLAPNVLPWYGLWLLPLLVLRDEPGALLFTGSVSLAYLVYPEWESGERWQVGWGVRALEYLPCVAVALLARVRSRPWTRCWSSSSGPGQGR